ncbi:hypothetical protein L6452_04679 [Arctium lappa]|uniref:Uncharacterized protein n=1 Tax=Arctium lappa TaxID=4217 RepID=A0ACB9EEN9_ARCLA|nr:hypothetical protein L6452_04679 [Arctium lappa]
MSFAFQASAESSGQTTESLRSASVQQPVQALQSISRLEFFHDRLIFNRTDIPLIDLHIFCTLQPPQLLLFANMNTSATFCFNLMIWAVESIVPELCRVCD